MGCGVSKIPFLQHEASRPTSEPRSLEESRKAVSYTPLDTSKHQIRVLNLSPGTIHKPLCCSLKTVDRDSNPVYEALSYEWGPPEHQSEIIYLDNNPVSIRQNLWWALYHLRHATEERIIWVDALCINQNDAEERTKQVSQMATIYSGAMRVISWIGREKVEIDLADEENCDASTAMSFLKEMSAQPRSDEEFKMLLLKEDINYTRKWTALLSLCRRTYWSRLWIVQETVLAAELLVQTDLHTISWSLISHVFGMIHKNFFQLRRPGSPQYHYYDVLKDIRATNAYRVHEVRVKNSKDFDSLFNLVIRFRESKCFDIRDKMFGILSIAFPCCRDAVPPDYSRELAQAMVLLLEHHLTHHRPSNKPQSLEYTHRLFGSFDTRIGVSENHLSGEPHLPFTSVSLALVKTSLKARLSTIDGGRIIYLSSEGMAQMEHLFSQAEMENENQSQTLTKWQTRHPKRYEQAIYRPLLAYYNPRSLPFNCAAEEHHLEVENLDEQNRDKNLDTCLRTLQIYWQQWYEQNKVGLDKLGIEIFLTSTGMAGSVTKGAKVGDRVRKVDETGTRQELLVLDGGDIASRITGKGLQYSHTNWEYPSSIDVSPLEDIKPERVMLEVDVITLIHLCGSFQVFETHSG